MHSATEITLRAMRFHALVGILPHEKANAQPIEIDLNVTIGPGEDVVDYRRLYEVTAAVIGAGHIDFLEDIAEMIADSAFQTSTRVSRARGSIRWSSRGTPRAPDTPASTWASTRRRSRTI